MKREDIIQSLVTRKIVIFLEMSSMNVDYFRYLALASNFLNFRLCEIQLGAQCLLGEHGPLSLPFAGICLEMAILLVFDRFLVKLFSVSYQVYTSRYLVI